LARTKDCTSHLQRPRCCSAGRKGGSRQCCRRGFVCR